MVLLTITPSMLKGLRVAEELAAPSDQGQQEPAPENPELGQPISHGQVVDLWKLLVAHGRDEFSLEKLLRGSRVYVAPPPPKPEPSSEYKVLMARLRREEEQRAYERMLSPPPFRDTLSTGPASSMAAGFARVNQPTTGADTGDDDVTYNDVHRQLMLIVNFIVTMGGVAATLWILARWWSTPARLMLAMGGAVLVGAAEVALYSGYVWHLSEAKKDKKDLREVKEVVNTWAVGGQTDGQPVKEPVPVDDDTGGAPDAGGIRRRRKDPT